MLDNVRTSELDESTTFIPHKTTIIWMGVVAMQKYAIILRNVFIAKLLYE